MCTIVVYKKQHIHLLLFHIFVYGYYLVLKRQIFNIIKTPRFLGACQCQRSLHKARECFFPLLPFMFLKPVSFCLLNFFNQLLLAQKPGWPNLSANCSSFLLVLVFVIKNRCHRRRWNVKLLSNVYFSSANSAVAFKTLCLISTVSDFCSILRQGTHWIGTESAARSGTVHQT